jgi:hypothetical protein
MSPIQQKQQNWLKIYKKGKLSATSDEVKELIIDGYLFIPDVPSDVNPIGKQIPEFTILGKYLLKDL